MLSSDAKVSIIFATGGLLAGLIGSRTQFLPAAIVGVALLFAIRKYSEKKFHDADIGQAGIMPYLTAWLATLVILANV